MGRAVPFSEVQKIIELARKSHIDTIDTAAAYGRSEEVLGGVGVSDFRVVSKVLPIQAGLPFRKSHLRSAVFFSLRRLNLSALYGLLVHNTSDLNGPSGQLLIETLLELKDEGIIRKVGVSVYDPEELELLLKGWSPDMVQLPLNLVDRRFERAGLLHTLRSMGIEIHSRSVFLQGLLLMPIGHIPSKFDRWRTLWMELERLRSEASVSNVALCLSYPLSLKEIDRVVVGVESIQQMEILVRDQGQGDPGLDLSFLESRDPILINPSKWKCL